MDLGLNFAFFAIYDYMDNWTVIYAISLVILIYNAAFSPMRTFSGENGKNLFWPRKSRESPALTPTFHIHLPETD